ncbi:MULTISPECIES: hypothetical protein [Haloferax]|uniref:Uncharacterized protein n=1 Tax=Haloferax marinum TaxID=2666143 RepID=A0A6A8G8P9_9EURY|nr:MULTISPECIES: hypothetical protein [Haloferax]KAB1198522.1 hypothetical protein Hfx1150_13765 [Haloferax sp. CBA1150]MRW97630.1 hypothetical protein [Haloferax marinum]
MVVSRYASILLFPPLGFATGVFYLVFIEGSLGFEGPTSFTVLLGAALMAAMFVTKALDDSLPRALVNILFTVIGVLALFMFALALPGD